MKEDTKKNMWIIGIVLGMLIIIGFGIATMPMASAGVYSNLTEKINATWGDTHTYASSGTTNFGSLPFILNGQDGSENQKYRAHWLINYTKNQPINIISEKLSIYIYNLNNYLASYVYYCPFGFNESTLTWNNQNLTNCNNLSFFTWTTSQSIGYHNITFDDLTKLNASKDASLSDGQYTLQMLWMNETSDNYNRVYNFSSKEGVYKPILYITYDLGYFVDYPTYNSSVLEYSNQSFNLSIPFNSSIIKSITAILNYNGTNYTSTGINDSTTWNFTRSLTIPAISADYNQSNILKWYYNVTYINDELVNSVTSDYNQTVYRLRIINTILAGSQNTILLKFFNEQSLASAVSSDIYSSWTIWGHQSVKTDNRTYNYTDTTATTKQYTLYPAWATGKTFAQFGFTATNYTEREFFLCNKNVTNSSQTFNIYLLSNTSDYQKFYFKVKSVGQTPIQNAVVTIEKKVSGLYYTLGARQTDVYGNAMERLIPDNQYRITVQDGETCDILKTFEVTLQCSALPCEYTLSISNVTSPFAVIDELPNFIYSIDWNPTTKIATVGYDGNAINSTLTSVQEKLYLRQPTGDTLICSNISLAPSDSLTCNISNYTAGSFIVYMDVNTTTANTFTRYETFNISNTANLFKTDGLIWGLLIILALFFIGIYNPSVAVGMGIVGVIIVGLIGIVSLSWLFFVCLAVIGITLIIKMKT